MGLKMCIKFLTHRYDEVAKAIPNEDLKLLNHIQKMEKKSKKKKSGNASEEKEKKKVLKTWTLYSWY